MILQILFWLSLFLIFYTYLLYPFLVWCLARRKGINNQTYSRNDDLPEITILMAVHNEEEVIKEKITGIFRSDYPVDKVHVMVGTDASTDHTDEILKDLSDSYERLRVVEFEKRSGKPSVINELAGKAGTDILILTDADVMLQEETLFELVKHFRNPDIGLVDSNMINKGLKKDGISIQETVYISWEVQVKNLESRVWGTMMGPFGGCYAMRRDLHSPVPENFLVDDFYINMKILEKGKKTINDLDAKVFEDVSNKLSDEFRRKTRIATGNFQNLFHFLHLLKKPFSALAFSFFSHKILRWIGPFFLLSMFISNFFLFNGSDFFRYAFLFQCIIVLIPLLDYLLRKIQIHILFLRFVTHFLAMNLAIIAGFIRYLTGVKSNVWQPTKRYQTR